MKDPTRILAGSALTCDLRPPDGVSHAPDACDDEVHGLELWGRLPEEEDDADGDVGERGQDQHGHLGDVLDQRPHQQGHEGPAHAEAHSHEAHVVHAPRASDVRLKKREHT
ncbi:hypothetical protein AVEN_190537-1 [Araneus ventricosus]|uniref:Uncharacterized protein n=1 Tax=Araneus ventricosus TaxID=182803 RepID=A0A4Y2CFI9_ARAVE|nr:hypothetical protein AVEN_190537-1 [Araneus ventricosus]